MLSPSVPSKTFLASAERPGAASIALRDHRLSENANIEKLGLTNFLNMRACLPLLPKEGLSVRAGCSSPR